MKTSKALLVWTVLASMLYVNLAYASSDEDWIPPRSHKKQERRVRQDPDTSQEQSTTKKRRGKIQSLVPNENDSRTEALIPHFSYMPADLFWARIAIHFEPKDLKNLKELSKSMRAQMTRIRNWFLVSCQNHYAQFGIQGFEGNRLQLMIRFCVPVIPATKEAKALSPQGTRHVLINCAGKIDSLQYRLANLYYFPKILAPSLANLKELNLSKSRLVELPASICQLTGLTTLNLAENELTSLPYTFGRLSRLQTLLIWHNRFSHFPNAVLDCQDLEYLDFGGNWLQAIPEDISRLAKLLKLALTGNRLSTIPAGLCSLKRLELLYLRKNSTLKTLPPEMITMAELRAVFLYGTRIRSNDWVIRNLNIDWVWARRGF